MQKPNAFIFAGANASGKSTFIAHLKSQNIIHGEYINPDLILKEELKLNESYENYLKAFELAKQKREIAIRNKKDIEQALDEAKNQYAKKINKSKNFMIYEKRGV